METLVFGEFNIVVAGGVWPLEFGGSWVQIRRRVFVSNAATNIISYPLRVTPLGCNTQKRIAAEKSFILPAEGSFKTIDTLIM